MSDMAVLTPSNSLERSALCQSNEHCQWRHSAAPTRLFLFLLELFKS